LTRSAWELLDAENRHRGYPALRHSGIYTRLRRPACPRTTTTSRQLS
jgi:hypothetical protein